MTVEEIYKKYKIMPNLAKHMYCVTGVAALICDAFKGELKKEHVVSACLIHDMGNIIKIDLDVPLEGFPIENLKYWKGVQKEYFEKYGESEHKATIEIAKELGVSEYTLKLINSIGYGHYAQKAEDIEYEQKIIWYSDMRVTPYGVASLMERLEDLEKRYSSRKEYDLEFVREREEKYLTGIEEQIFSHCDIEPEDITAETVFPSLESLSTMQIV